VIRRDDARTIYSEMSSSERRDVLVLAMAAALAPLRRPRAGTSSILASATPANIGFRHSEFGIVGVFDADWLTNSRYTRLLDTVAASPGAIAGIRVFGILNAGSHEDDFPTASGGTWTDTLTAPDFTVALDCLDRLVGRGLVPFLPLTFFPTAVSPSPIRPPSDFGSWKILVRAFVDAAAARFGPAEIARWSLEVWNEPNMPQFWRGSFDAYLELYRATAVAVRQSGHRVRLGGPAIAWMPHDDGPALMARFLLFLRSEPDLPCDFVSFHRKGVWSDAEGEPRIERLVEAAETTAQLALRLVPERCARGLLVINNEADMRVGFQRPYEPRMSERFPSWLAAVAATHAELSVRHASHGLRFAAVADNANQHLVREPFDGRRALMTPTAADRPEDLLKLPVFNFYEMLRLMGGTICSAGQPRECVYQLVAADEGRIGVLVTHHPNGPSEAAAPLELEVRDIPWRRANLAMFRIDGTHSNAFAANRRRMPSPPLASSAVRRLRHAAELAKAASLRPGLRMAGGRLRLPLLLQPFATVLAWITPFDPVPPAPPRWIEASLVGADAVLRWAPNNEPGVFGYEVLRLGLGRSVAPLPLRGALWVDTAPPAAGPLRYAVRAISTSGRASPRVATRLLRP
jgi:xylan 1,4-beta-xylosidase